MDNIKDTDKENTVYDFYKDMLNITNNLTNNNKMKKYRVKNVYKLKDIKVK